MEVRLAAPASLLARIAQSHAVQDCASGAAGTREQQTTYWDTPEYAFRSSGVALRMRSSRGAEDSMSVKSEGTDPVTRQEIEIPANGSRPSFAALQAAGWRARKKLLRLEEDIGPVLVSEVRRETVPLAFPDGTRAALMLDRGHLRALRPGVTGTVAISEVEIELIDGDRRRVFELASRLVGELPGLRLSFTSKAERGFVMLTGHPPPPRKAEPLTAPRKSSPGRLAVRAATEAVMQIARNLEGAIAGRDAAYVHQLRIGVRRYRVALWIARTAGLASPAAPLLAEVSAVWEVLGRVRDWDVFAEGAWPVIAAAAGSLDGRAIEARIARERTALRRSLQTRLAAPRFQQALLAMLWSLEHQREEAQARKAHGARAFARKTLNKRLERLARRGNAAQLAPDERHRVRIEAKKLRYAAEFFAHLFRRRDVQTFVARLAALQDDLGALNDVVAARDRLDAVQPHAAKTAAALRELWSMHAQAREQALHESLLRTAHRFARVDPFWR